MTVVGLSELLRFKRAYMVDLVRVWGLTVWVAIWRGNKKLLLGWGGASCPGQKLRKREQIAEKFAFQLTVKLYCSWGKKCVVSKPVIHLHQSSIFASNFKAEKTHNIWSRDVAKYLPAVHQDQYLGRYDIKCSSITFHVQSRQVKIVLDKVWGCQMEGSQPGHHGNV